MLHCNLRVRWKVASDLRSRAAIPISGDLAPLTRKSLAIAIVRFQRKIKGGGKLRGGENIP